MNINKITKRFRNPYENNRKYENQKTKKKKLMKNTKVLNPYGNNKNHENPITSFANYEIIKIKEIIKRFKKLMKTLKNKINMRIIKIMKILQNLKSFFKKKKTV